MTTRRTRLRRRDARRWRAGLLAAFTAGLLAAGGVAVSGAVGGGSSPPPLYCSGHIDANTGGSIGCLPGSLPGSTSTSSSPSSTSSSSSTTAPSTTTSTTTLPASSCGPAARTLSGPQTQAFSGAVNGTLNASAATWTNVVYPFTATGGSAGACLEGGRFLGTWGESQPWSFYHDTAGAVRWTQPSFTVDHVTSAGLGDAFKPKDGASHWRIAHSYGRAYDDCIEDDYLWGGTVQDTLLECYSGFSTRASSGQGGGDLGPVTFDHVLMRLVPQTNVYKGPVPGTGGFFKQAEGAPQPTFVLRDNTFRADQLPNHQDLKPPSTLTACSGNTILWGGAGSFPETAAWRAACPDTVIVNGQAAVTLWANARTAWFGGF